jgi:hypothetical protein
MFVVAQLIKKFDTCIAGTRTLAPVFRNPPLGPVVIQMNQVHTIEMYSCKIHLNITFRGLFSDFPACILSLQYVLHDQPTHSSCFN